MTAGLSTTAAVPGPGSAIQLGRLLGVGLVAGAVLLWDSMVNSDTPALKKTLKEIQLKISRYQREM